jgi:ABC-type transport system substrate-binding protein
MHEMVVEGSNAITQMNIFRPTADLYLSQYFASDARRNYSNYSVDELRDQARAETDPDAQAQLWKDAAIEIQKNFAAKGLLANNQTYARSNAVDYGHELVSVVQLYPGIDETTTISE